MPRPVDKIKFIIDEKRTKSRRIRAYVNDIDIAKNIDDLDGCWEQGGLIVDVKELVESMEKEGDFDIFTSSFEDFRHPCEIGLNSTMVEHENDFVTWKISKSINNATLRFVFHKPQLKKAIQSLLRRIDNHKLSV